MEIDTGSAQLLLVKKSLRLDGAEKWRLEQVHNLSADSSSYIVWALILALPVRLSNVASKHICIKKSLLQRVQLNVLDNKALYFPCAGRKCTETCNRDPLSDGWQRKSGWNLGHSNNWNRIPDPYIEISHSPVDSAPQITKFVPGKLRPSRPSWISLRKQIHVYWQVDHKCGVKNRK